MNGSENPEAAFLAVMTASATHEVRNVLAIIKESAGLIQDMVHLFEKKGSLDRDKLHRTVDRIDTQVKRGADLLTSLNRLSHTLDSRTTTVELNSEVRELVFLSQRSARKRRQNLKVLFGDRDIPLTLNQLHLDMVLFSALGLLLDSLREGAAITVEVMEPGGVAAVEFRGVQADGPPPVLEDGMGDGLDSVLASVRALGAELEVLQEGFGHRILFPPTTGA